MNTLRPFLIVGIAIGLFYVYAWPQWGRIAIQRTQDVEIQSALGKAQELTQIRNQLMSQYGSISPEDTAKIARVVPAVYDPVKLVTDINALALQYGMIIREVKIAVPVDASASGAVEAPVAQPAYIKRDLSFTTSGQYKSFLAFISDVESSLQLMDIQKIDISTVTSQKPGSNTGANFLDFKVTLHTYWIQ